MVEWIETTMPGAGVLKAQIYDPRTGAVDWHGDDVGQQYAGTKFGDHLDGAAGNDTLFGSKGDDFLFGNDGGDRLSGGDNNDWLVGDEGYDTLDGGTGWDVASYLETTSGIVVDLTTNQNGGPANGDFLTEIEVVQGSGSADTIIGLDRGGGLGVELLGMGGDDVLSGKAGADTLDGGDNGDWLYGNEGVDVLKGGANNDWLVGGEGADVLHGGDDWDVASYLGTTGGIVVDLTTNENGGAAAGDALIGIEVVQGSGSADTIIGLDRGGGLGVELLGMGGDDVLSGKAGHDTLDGGSGVDTAVFTGSRQGYVVTKNPDGHFTIAGQEGVDLLKDVEYARFGDQTVFLADLTASANPDVLTFMDDTTARSVEADDVAPILGTLKAQDPDDPANTLTFSIDQSDLNHGKFTITDGNVLSVASGVLAAGTYTVKVRVTDPRGGSLVQDFTITSHHPNVAPVSDGVTAQNLGQAGTGDDLGKILVNENHNQGAFEIARVAAHDTDGGTISYALTTNPNDIFAIDQTTGMIQVANAAALQVTQDTEYALVVTISDGQGGTTTQNVTVKVLDVNRAPVIDNLSGTSADEDDDVGTEVGVFAVHDPDGPSTDLVFELVNNAEGRFAVDGTGRLTLARALTDADVGTYQITLRVSDKGSQTGSLSTEQTFTITVNDVVNGNHAPDTLRLNGGTIATVNENALFEGVLSARDDDGDTSFTWSFDNAAGHDNALFEIDNQTKTLKLKAGVDYEALALNRKYLMVYLKASDGKTGGTSATQAFKITIEGIDEAPDTIRLKDATAVTLDENTPTGQEVGLLSAHDPEGRGVTYALADDANGRFKLDATGIQIVVADGSLLDYEALPNGAKYYDIKVVATDTGPGHKSAEQIIRVNLSDQDEPVPPPPPNSPPTDLSLSDTAASEYAAAGTLVGSLRASDANNDPLSYALLDNAGGRFMLSGNQILVADGFRLDFEQERSHKVTVQVSDGRGGVATQVFTIGIGDLNPEVTAGSAGNDVFKGGALADKLGGGLGHDALWGGLGNDHLTGGGGKDIFVFDTRTNKRTNVDRIVDFRSQDDSFYLDNMVFTKLGSGTLSNPKKFKSDMFINGTKAQDREDRIVYDKKSGALYYDQDGTGSKAQVKIATISNKTKLNYHDFFVI